MREELGNFFLPHFARVALLVVKNETLDPIHVHLLGADAVLFAANNVADRSSNFGLFSGEPLATIVDMNPILCLPWINSSRIRPINWTFTLLDPIFGSNSR